MQGVGWFLVYGLMVKLLIWFSVWWSFPRKYMLRDGWRVVQFVRQTLYLVFR